MTLKPFSVKKPPSLITPTKALAPANGVALTVAIVSLIFLIAGFMPILRRGKTRPLFQADREAR
jgi:hypothetical protein